MFSAGLMPEHKSILDAIALGPDGNMWFADDGGPQAIGRITPSGVITEFSKGLASTAKHGTGILDITAGPDGDMWFIGKGDTIGLIGTGTGGANHRQCTVPNVVGSKLARAKRTLSRAGCSLGPIKKRKEAKHSRGRIVAQSPHPGRKLPRGRKVKVTVGSS
jgi:hypothetical protein